MKEKVLAATRAGINTVLLPARNRKDLEDVPETARQHVKFVWLERVDDAIVAALESIDRHDDETARNEPPPSRDRQAARSIR